MIEGDNRPLALNAWDFSGPNSQSAALAAVDMIVNPEKDEFLRDNPVLTNFIVNALYQRVTSQSQANFVQYQAIEPFVTPDELPYTQGQKTPAELAGYLLWHSNLDSIEIGRRTLNRTWDTAPIIDAPLRQNLDETPLLATTRQKSPTLYRLKNLNVVDQEDKRYLVQVDRKRTVRRHFGGRVLTVVRNSVVLHNTDERQPLPRGIRKLISDERKRAMSDPAYDYDQHSDELRGHLESHIAAHEQGEKPAWIVPILTTYYSVKFDAVKAERLKEIEEA